MLRLKKGPLTFDCAHLLPQHKGLCSNIHGHTYKCIINIVFVNDVVEGSETLEEALCMDFNRMKFYIKEVISEYDHATIVNANSVSSLEKELMQLCIKYDSKLKCLNGVTTVENMAKHILKDFFRHLAVHENVLDIDSIGITLYETPTSAAQYTLKILDGKPVE